MTHFLSLGGSDSLAALTSRLRDKGAEESSDVPSLVLVAADSLQHAEELVAGLPLALRRRTVLLGIDEGLAPMPSKGSLAELLERFQLLGALPADQTAKPTIDRFLGPKKDHLCELVGASYFKGYSSPNYAVWSRFADVDAATFLLSLIAAFEADGRWLREGPDFPSRP